MDTATAAPVAPAAGPSAGAPPIGVASISAPAGLGVPPSAVPSAPVTPVALAAVEGSIPADATAFPPGVAARLQSYVYLLVDPKTGRPFCVGAGRGDRCFRHVRAAARPPGPDQDGPGDPSAKYPALTRIRAIESGGRSVRIEVLRYGLTPDEARVVEAAVHEALGLPGPPRSGSQRRSAAAVGARLAKRAKIKRPHQLVLLRVGGTGADTSYERVRHGWRIGRRWTDLDSPRSPRWVATVAGDLIAAVYRIDRWDRAPSPVDPVGPDGVIGSRPPDRFSFVGAPDPELERRYVGRSVTAHLGEGSRSPVTYVWCGPHWVNAPG